MMFHKNKYKQNTYNSAPTTFCLLGEINILISYPTHILLNSSTCIELIFIDQLNLVADNGIHPSLHINCHHQITYSKFNLIIENPPLYWFSTIK